MRAEKRIHELEAALAAAQQVELSQTCSCRFAPTFPWLRRGLQLCEDDARKAACKASETHTHSDATSKEASVATLEAALTEKMRTNRRLEHKLQELGINPGR